MEGIQVHNKLVLGVNMEACAQLCLAELTFKCSSFDYVFREQSCQMSQLIAANVHGMRTQFDTAYHVMHFELIGKLWLVTVLPAKSDSDAVFCLQLLSRTLTCTLHRS